MTDGRPGPGGDALVLLTSDCWACPERAEKRVPLAHRAHQHFSWSCPQCEVSWSGPGEAAA